MHLHIDWFQEKYSLSHHLKRGWGEVGGDDYDSEGDDYSGAQMLNR